MILLKLMMKLRMNKGVDKLLNWHNGFYFNCLNPLEVKEFLKWYLNQEYSSETNLEVLYDYLRKSLKIISFEEVDFLAVDANIFQVMPSFVALKTLKGNYKVDKDFIDQLVLVKTLLTSKVTDENLIKLLNRDSLVDEDYIYRKLVEEQDIDSLGEIGAFLDSLENKNRLAQMMIMNGSFTVLDMKKFWEKSGLAILDIIDLIGYWLNKVSGDEKEKLLVILEDYIRKNQNEETVFFKIREKIIGGFLEDTQVLLLKKLWLDKEYDLIFLFLKSGIETNYNYNLIANLVSVSENLAIKTLISVREEDLEYTFMQIVKRGKNFAFKTMEIMVEKFKPMEIGRIDKILDMVYRVYFDFKFHKENAVALILAGSKYTLKFMSEIDLGEKERALIFKAYQNDSSFLLQYGDYLKAGDKKENSTQSDNLCLRRNIRTRKVKDGKKYDRKNNTEKNG